MRSSSCQLHLQCFAGPGLPTYLSPKPTFCSNGEIRVYSLLWVGWGGGGGLGWLVYLVLQLHPIIWHQIVWSRNQNFNIVATQSFLGRLSNPSWSHQSTKRQCYLPNQNKTQAYVGTIRGILLVAYFSIVPLFDSWLCYICNIYLTSP